MRQLTILLIALVAICAVPASAALNCSALPALAEVDNFYGPPKSLKTEVILVACNAAWEICQQSATTCDGLMNQCALGYLRCIELAEFINNTVADSPWLKNVQNMKLYLAAGGLYTGSTIEASCEQAYCHVAQLAEERATITGACPTAADLCVEPVIQNQENPTAAPDAAVYSISFAGDFAEMLKDTVKKLKLKIAVTKGLAKVLGTQPAFIVITKMIAGSLVIEFYVTDATVDATAVKTKLETAISSPDATVWEELSTEAGFAVELKSLTVQDFSTPAPTNGAVAASFAAALVALVCLAL